MLETVSTTRKVPAGSRKRQNLANYGVMKWLEGKMHERGLSKREIGRRLGHANATRVGQYLSQRIVAGPDVLGRLAAAVGVSPIEALWRAGRQDFVFEYLQALYELGWWWMHKDRVHLDQKSGALFFGRDAAPRKSKRAAIQYDPSRIPSELEERYHSANVENTVGRFNRTVALPKPMACAIVLAVGLFPRRGDRVRPETQRFLDEVGRVAFAYIAATERRRVPQELKNLQRALTSAGDVLKFRFYGRPRLAIVGEYAHSWADFVCRDYADYARLALYEQGGILGSASDDGDNWAWQAASIPSPVEFAIDGDFGHQGSGRQLSRS